VDNYVVLIFELAKKKIEDCIAKTNKTFGIDLLTSLPQLGELTICCDSLL
jgi:hypothetical protein